MGRCIEKQPPVKLFFALMSSDAGVLAECRQRFALEFSPIDLEDPPFAFDPFTSYYAEEFGAGLIKQFVAVRDLIAPEKLLEVKRHTNQVEEYFAQRDRPNEPQPPRIVNIDPGYLSLSKVVLATTKDHSHRIYVGRGIFEEVTLSYRNATKGWVANPWTYPDYSAPERLDFLARLREIYKSQLK